MLSMIVFAASGTLNMPCAELKNIELERATITSAVDVAAGLFKPAGAADGPPQQSGPPPQPIPQHCRLTLVLKPTPDSNINVELWLPTENWNGKFLAVGNGGWAGAMQGYGDMQAALRRGYATAATDTGHSDADGPAGMFALGHPEKIVDFAYRALHDMTVKSKRLIDVFYAEPLDYSYYKGCSTGGRQGVMAAQRYPGDYDGIIAGALANRHIHMHTAGAYRGIHLARHPDEAVSEAKAKLVNDAVMAKCDTLGEGFLNNPRQCSFDFSTLACGASGAGDSCLTPGELKSVQTFYGGLRNSKGELVFSGQALWQPDAGAHELAGGAERRSHSTPSASSASRTPTTTGGSSISIAICRSSMPPPASSMPSIPTCARSKRTAASCCCTPVGATPASRPRTRCSTTRACARRWAPSRLTGCGCSWRPAWGTAAAVRVSTRSTRWPRSSNGASATSRRSRCWLPAGSRALRGRFAPTRRTRSTMARAISRTPRTGAARQSRRTLDGRAAGCAPIIAALSAWSRFDAAAD